MKYKDQSWPAGSPIAGEKLSANGVYTGQQEGTPMQGHGETAANANAYYTEHGTVRFGTAMQDAGDSNFLSKCFVVSYNLNGGTGVGPVYQEQGFAGGALTLPAFPVTAAVANYYDEDIATPAADTSLLVVADSATPEAGEIKLSDVSPAKSTYTPTAGDYVKLVAYSSFNKWNTKADGTGTGYAAAASLTPAADTTLYATYTE